MARRKRASYRTKQAPVSLSQRTRRIFAWLGALLALLLLACAGAYLFFMSWLQGDGFRRYLATAIQQASGAAEVSIPQNLAIDGSRMTLPECRLAEAPRFRELSLRKLHLEVDRPALLHRWLRFRHLSAEELQITLSTAAEPPRRAAAAPALPTAEGSAAGSFSAAAAEAPAASAEAAPKVQQADSAPKGFLKGVQLSSFESHYTTTTLLTGKDGGLRYSLSGYHLTATPKRASERDSWVLTLENGRVLTPFAWLRECGLKGAKIFCREDEIRLNEARILLTPGDMTLSGVFTPSSGLWSAEANISQANVARILNDDWKKRLTGRLRGQLTCSGRHPGAWQAKGHLRLEKGQLEGLPILSDLRLNGSRPYRTLKLEKASCTLSYPYSDAQHGITDAWLWDRIDIRTEGGTLLVRGRIITGTDGSLSGALDIGLPAKVLAELGLNQSPAVAQLFNAPVTVPGYAWVHVNLSGTVSSPQEDLSVRLATILPQALPGLADQAVKSLGSALSSFLQDKPSPAAQAEDTPADSPAPPPAPKPAKQIQDVIQNGLDMIF